jgi:hypothetical protein
MFTMAVLVSACSTLVGENPTPTNPGGSTPSTPGSTEPATTEPGSCIRFTGDHSSPIDTGTTAGDALYLSGEVFICAQEVVVVSEGDLNEVAAASQLAAAVSGPLLFPDPRLAAELGRLDPDVIHVVGNADVNTPSGAEVVNHDTFAAVALASERLGTSERSGAPPVPDASTVVDTVLAITAGDRVVVPETAGTSSTAAPGELDVAAIVDGLAVASEAAAIWLVEASKPTTILLAASAGHAIDAIVAAVDGSDILGYPALAEVIQGHDPANLRYVGGVGEASEWELAVLANGQQVPGGGFHILPREGLRRYVAFYGHPETAALGALGEQPPAETRARMDEFVQAYTADGAQVIPTFEMIATVASAGPGEDGDYSFEWSVDTFTPWIDYATENGMYVMLDLQSGREDFLSQAMLYEELLLRPNVGLALDPEWRLTDTQVHLEQTGTVDAAEVNETVNWVADLVRDNGLPQKMMIVHQFRTDMITNRAEIVQRPEIQMIVQMDGDGTEAEKDSTWSRLHEGADDAHWAWGWKNFFDEDEPGPPSPESTMGKVPTPVYVSYQ